MIIIDKYGNKIDIESLIAQGITKYELDSLDIDKVIKITISQEVRFESFLSGPDLKIEFTKDGSVVMMLVLKDMGDLLADNDGDSLVQIVLVNDTEGEILLADMTDFSTAFAATAAAGDAQGTASATPISRFDRTNDRAFGDVSSENVRPEDNLSPFAASADLVGEILTGLEADTAPANSAPSVVFDAVADIHEDFIGDDSRTFKTFGTDASDKYLIVKYSVSDGDGAITNVSITNSNTDLGEIHSFTETEIYYRPKADAFGDDSIIIKATDNLGLVKTISISLKTISINDAPIIDETINVTVSEDSLADLDIGIIQLIATNDTQTVTNPFTGEDIVTPIYGFDVSSENAQVIAAFNQIGANSIKAHMISVFQAIAIDASGQALPESAINVDVTITNSKVEVSASVLGLPFNPFAQTAVLDSVRDTLIDRLGENFQLPFENGTYQGSLNLVDIENDVTSITHNNLKLVLTTTNESLIALFEQAQDIQNSTIDRSFLEELLKTYKENGIPDNEAQTKSVTIDGLQLKSLIEAGLFTLHFNLDGTYTIASTLFNMMSEEETLSVQFDYTATDEGGLSDSGSANIVIEGTNDAPIALDSEDEKLLENGETLVDGSLPGSYTLTTLLDLKDSFDTSNGIAGIVDIDELMDEVQNTVTVNVDVDSARKDELIDGLMKIVFNNSAGTNFNEEDTKFFRESSSKLNTLQSDIEDAVQDKIDLYSKNPDATTPNAFTLTSTYDNFFASFTTNGNPVITFDTTKLNDALSTFILSNQDDAAKDVFEDALGEAITEIDGIDDTSTPAGKQAIKDYLDADKALDTDGDNNTSSYVKATTDDAFDNAETQITDKIIDEAETAMANVVTTNLGALSSADEASLKTYISDYLDARMGFENEVAEATEPSLDDLKLNIVNLYVSTTLDQTTFDRVVEIGEAIKDINTGAVNFNSIDQDTVLTEVLKRLGLEDIEVTDYQNDLIQTAKDEIKAFNDSLDLGTLLLNPEGINTDLKKLLDTSVGVFNDLIEDIFTKDDGSAITNDDIYDTIKEVVGEELDRVLEDTMDDLKTELATINVAQAILDQLPEDVNTYLTDEMINEDSVQIDIEAMKTTAINNLLEQTDLAEYDLLDKTSRDELVDVMVQDLIDRMGMDEDLADMGTLKYEIVENSILTTVNGTPISGTNVTIDEKGGYTIENPGFDSVDASQDVQVTFQYRVNDGDALSDPKTATVNIDLEDKIETQDTDNLADVLNGVSGLDSLDMTAGDHVLSGLDLSDYVALTDDDNTLKVYGDSGDSINLAASDWTQSMLKDTDGLATTTPYQDANGFHVYTATSGDDTIKLLIENNITVNEV